jgi:hypothetical protein
MKRTLVMIALGILLPGWAMAGMIQIGGGIQTSILSYNQDALDTSKLFWGGHVRVRPIKFVAGEFSFQKREDNFDYRRGNIKLETTPLQLSALVYPLGMFSVSPYFVAGTGWYYLTATVTGDLGLPFVTGEGTIKHTETAGHIGVGVEAFIGDHFSMGADVRKIFLEFNTSIISYKVNAYFVNIGATFYF